VKTEPDAPDQNKYMISDLVFLALVINGLPLPTKIEVNKRLKITGTTSMDDLETVLQMLNSERVELGGKKESPIIVASTDANRPQCTFCRKIGHKENKCWKKNPKGKFKKKVKQVHMIEVSVSETDIPSGNFWLVDSCAGAHIVRNKNLFSKLSPVEETFIRFANGKTLSATASGSMRITLGDGQSINLNDVLLVPNLQKKIISLGKLTSEGWIGTFTDTHCEVRHPVENVILQGVKRQNIFGILGEDESVDVNYVTTELMHKRLAHAGKDTLVKMGYKTLKSPCTTCLKAEHPAKNVNRTGKPLIKTTMKLEKIYCDLIGPLPSTFGGATYILVIIDDYTRYTFVYLLKSKSETLSYFKKFKVLAENQTGKKIKEIQINKGGEFSSKEFIEFCDSAGILKVFAPTAKKDPHCSIIERVNRTLMVKTRAFLIESNSPIQLWGEAVYAANFVRNRTYSHSLDSTPFERMFEGKKFNMNFLKVWGCKAMVRILPKNRAHSKLTSQSKELMFVGYSEDHNHCWKFFDPETRKVYVSEDAKFFENDYFTFPVCDNANDYVDIVWEPSKPIEENLADDNPVEENPVVDPVVVSSPLPSDKPEDSVQTNVQQTQKEPTVRKQSRSRDFDDIASGRVSLPPRKAKINHKYVENHAVKMIKIPFSYEEAISCPEADKWIAAMDAEMEAIIGNKTYTLVDLIENRKLVGVKWVYDLKRDEEGNILKFKARLVAKGFTQVAGVDYFDTYAPVARPESIRVFFALSAQKNLIVKHWDFSNAFLAGNLSEEIYMRQPQGYSDGTNKVCKLLKSLYGLKQASRVWNEKLVSTLISLGYRQLISDYCFFINDKTGEMIVSHVDDILCAFISDESATKIFKELEKTLKLRDLGLVKHFLGIRVTRVERGFLLSQDYFISELLNETGMSDCKPVATPIENLIPLTVIDFEAPRIKYPYREIIGKLNHLAVNTRPDLSTAVSILSLYSDCFNETHVSAVKRVLRYLKGTPNLGLLIFPDETSNLKGFADSDWGGDIETRKSTSGYVCFFAGTLVSWKSKRQLAVSLSSMEGELYALVAVVQELT
jgi:hypothetical protein